MSDIALKRVYEPWSESDGKRVLVDRLWPRGLTKEAARVDVWLRDIAPSPELRNWFCHKPERFAEFREQYRLELTEDSVHQAAVQQILTWVAEAPVTLVYAARDPVHNHAIVLHEFLTEQL
jgi:uncharacterized protein YeaO (DUF488 family)